MSKDSSPQKAIVMGPGTMLTRSDPGACQVPASWLQSACEANLPSLSNRIVYLPWASAGTVHCQDGLFSPPDTRYQVVAVSLSVLLTPHPARSTAPKASSMAIAVALRTTSSR